MVRTLRYFKCDCIIRPNTLLRFMNMGYVGFFCKFDIHRMGMQPVELEICDGAATKTTINANNTCSERFLERKCESWH